MAGDVMYFFVCFLSIDDVITLSIVESALVGAHRGLENDAAVYSALPRYVLHSVLCFSCVTWEGMAENLPLTLGAQQNGVVAGRDERWLLLACLMAVILFLSLS